MVSPIVNSQPIVILDQKKLDYRVTILKLLIVSIPFVVSLCFYLIVFRERAITGYWPAEYSGHADSVSMEIGHLNWFLMFPAIFGLPVAVLCIPLGIKLILETTKRHLASKKMVILMSCLLLLGGLGILSIFLNIRFLSWMLD